MLFNSITFAVFAALFYPLWALIRRSGSKPAAWAFITAASFVFYGWWNWRYLFLLVGTGLVAYGASLAMIRWPRRKGWLLAGSLTANLGALFLFKYLDFAIGTSNLVLDALGMHGSVVKVGLTLPIGISFYTFHAMSYSIDVYRELVPPARNPLHFFAFLSMFPQLIAGPIVRAPQILPQLEALPASTAAQRWSGFKLITYGLVKKLIVADALGRIVDAQYAGEPVANTLVWWTVAVLYAIQLYCDFSGYSDIAIGLARWMGITFADNFRHPYVSSSFRDFWNRWHISMSTWFRDYIYYPLARRWPGRVGMLLAVNLTFLGSGLWHGASVHFLLWGLFHGMLLGFEQLTNWDRRMPKSPAGRITSTVIVFLTICVTMVLFRARDVHQAFAVYASLFSWHAEPASVLRLDCIYALLFILIEARHVLKSELKLVLAVKELPAARVLGPLVIGVLLAACVLLGGSTSPFIYFEF